MESWKKTFAVIWSGQLASILSSEVVAYSIIFWMSLETGSAEVLALAAIAGMLPQSLLGPLVGVYVDRWDRKRTMILADSFIALCTLALTALFWLGAARMWHIYILLACRSAGSAFHIPAMQASVPLLAPASQLTRIAGVNQIIASLSSIAGPALGALLINLTSIGNILLLDVAGAAIACISLLCVRIPNPARDTTRKPDLWREFREGFSAMHAIPGMGWFFTLAIVVWFFIMPVGVMFPLMTLQHFGGGAFEMSLIEIVWGGGALVGGAVMGARTYRVSRIVLVNLMYLVVGLSFALSGLLSPAGFLWFALFTAAAGISSSVFNASFVSVVHPDRSGHAGTRHVALPQFRAAAGGPRTAGHGIPGRERGTHHDLRRRRNDHRRGGRGGILHPLRHAARPQPLIRPPGTCKKMRRAWNNIHSRLASKSE